MAPQSQSRLSLEEGPPQELCTARLSAGQELRIRVMPRSNWAEDCLFPACSRCFSIGFWVAEVVEMLAMVTGERNGGYDESVDRILFFYCGKILK
ncbi:hypothetical protein I7I48_10805 [Histoplasma ohiense]|nr:hypothetical protein I7I48_10805 [Histoplasma ohiense (nom. inval.)]